ncbi:hypothetical protein ILFOPFJJ_03418 [Ensifer psoraleae]|uniref:hypothetical protein n=1 Tax=Sinorhizobium psoraleae TaxID=520838 RepID=UPI0015690DF7|nr:hypothetical protein [Sinorhizobium psoraleae]NRP72520.1 hypothetical protein [Sinorhizobium psoraleae]
MAKEGRRPDRKEGERRDSKKPGTIVAGPDAHARERAGKAPSKRGGRQMDDPAGDPANRSERSRAENK